MSDQATIPYHTNHVTFALPAQLKDKTMHMFTLNDNGPSAFSVVISHAEAQPEDTLEDFSKRLVQELEKALPKFLLANSRARLIDGAEAVELAYSWRSEGNFLHQRQVITLMPPSQAGAIQAMLIGATCLRAFNQEWNDAFDGILDSMQLRGKPAPASAYPAIAAASALPTVFALSERRRTLHAFADQEEACRKTDAREVEQDAWAFFDAAGAPLHAHFVVPNSGTVWFKAGTYVLEARPGQAAPTLRERLSQASVLVASSPAVPFASIADVQAHLDQSAGT